MELIFDSHAHYDDEQFDCDRDELLSSMKNRNVGHIISCGVDIKSSEYTVELCKKYPFIHAAIGYHPCNIPDDAFADLDSLRLLSKKRQVVAIGEIGLDYYWDKSRIDIQKDFFKKQLTLANELNLPVIIHSRDATEETLDIVKKHRAKGVIHCFSGSPEIAEEYIKLGYYIGIGGAVTFKNARKLPEVLKKIPLDRLLLETDCPYMAPEPFRGKRNDSSLIIYIAEKISQLVGVSTDNILKATYENAVRLFL